MSKQTRPALFDLESFEEKTSSVPPLIRPVAAEQIGEGMMTFSGLSRCLDVAGTGLVMGERHRETVSGEGERDERERERCVCESV